MNIPTQNENTANNVDQILATIGEDMDKAIRNDAEVWTLVNDSLLTASAMPDTASLVAALTLIVEKSFDFRAANSASLSRFIAHNTVGLKVAVNGKAKTCKITIKQNATEIMFQPQGDWAKFKAPPKPDTRSLEQAVIDTIVARVKSNKHSVTMADVRELDFGAIIEAVSQEVE